MSIHLLAEDKSIADKGKAVFRGNCAFCHGQTGHGGRGPNLVSHPLTHGDSDEAIQTVVRKGVPGSTMPAFELESDEVTALIKYLRTLMGAATPEPPLAGNVENGKKVYHQSGCSSCHQISGAGSTFGPDLSRVGSARPVEYLRESIERPSADIPEEYEAVTVVTSDGKRYMGIRVNEDTFSVQMRDPAQRFRTFRKDQLREVQYPKDSLMPAYTSLKPADLNDLLAYLSSLRGGIEKAGVKTVEGIR